jgi:hypothetical protein
MAATPTFAQDASPAPTKKREPRGTWRFIMEDRPIKVVVLGGSVSAWKRGNFGQFLQETCARVEVKNRSKARLGAKALRQRFIRQVIDNRRIEPGSYEGFWLIFNGGLNSVGNPEKTNHEVAKTLSVAHEHGIRTIAVSVGPWGSKKDKRWKGADASLYRARTKHTVDFLVGRLTPSVAFGRFLREGAKDAFDPAQLPEIAVDIYDSSLRDRDAELRSDERVRRQMKRAGWVKDRLRDLEQTERDALFETLVQEAREIPRWFMRKDLQAFDHIHPNMEGHRQIAKTICPRLPTSWGCDCGLMDQLAWTRGHGLNLP